MAEVAYQVPSQIRAGNSIAWKRTLSNYPATVWTLTYIFINAAAKFSVECTADGLNFLASITPEVSGLYAPGWYGYIAQVSNGDELYTIEEGRVRVLPDLSSANTYDVRSHARKMLEAIEALLEDRATGNQIDIIRANFGARVIERGADKSSLLAVRDKYRAEVAAEENAEKIARGEISGRRVRTRLGS